MSDISDSEFTAGQLSDLEQAAWNLSNELGRGALIRKCLAMGYGLQSLCVTIGMYWLQFDCGPNEFIISLCCSFSMETGHRRWRH
jgi:hypothetical protein